MSSQVIPLMPKRRPELEAADLLDAKALAKRWGCHRDSIYKIPADQLPYVRLGRRRRYRLADILVYEERYLITGR